MFDTMLADWVVENSSTTGTGAYALGGAPAGTSYFTFRQRIGNGDPVAFYFVRNSARTKWELNVSDWLAPALCTLTYGSPDSLARNVVKSSNSDVAVSWVSGDLPLRVYMAPFSALWEAIVSGMLADAIGDLSWLRHGEWFRDSYPSTNWRTKYLYDGTGSGIALGKYQTTARKFIPDPAAINFPPGHIHGLTYGNNAVDATNDIDIFAGGCEDSTGVYPMVLAATLTKRLDAAWAVGDGNGGLDTGSIANADYYIHLIARSDTAVVDALFSLSATAPTMPANYDYFRPFGWFKRSGGAILGFKTYELGGVLLFKWNSARFDVDLLNTLTTSRRTDALSVPLDFSTEALLRPFFLDAVSNYNVIVNSPDETDAAPVTNGAPGGTFLSVAAGNTASGEFEVQTSSTGTIAARSSVATVDTYRIWTKGFKWSRR